MKLRTALVAAAIVLAASLPAYAGLNSASYVRVYTTSAFGPVHDARFNAGSTEYIGCSIAGFSSSPYVYCSARDSDSNFLSCFKYSPNNVILNAIGSINEASNIEFYVDSSTGDCTTIYISNYSNWL